ncbi:nuclear transport factor 2 family protein [Kangiella shandongensis]|uniref:DUF4440 domain-containing protein n=1 Tax=Kangiella shandongensis TaxID=2763258 RepID=UPI001CBDD6B7|nr:DUF4440 domain-containing protein [Kangiella shandongensis]
MKSVILMWATLTLTTGDALAAQNIMKKSSNKTLPQQINYMDHKLFNIGFNQCNFEVWQGIVSEELEFYDDRTGLNTSFEKEVKAFKDKCSKPFDVTRKLISSEVHKLGDFGAFQTGKHKFYVDGNLVETAQFAVIWQQTDTGWVVKRIVSYDHKTAK